MESQSYIEYELIEPVLNQNLTTGSREQSLDFFRKKWLVYENHYTVCHSSECTTARMIVTRRWNNNPEF